jgi:hypothetical protein
VSEATIGRARTCVSTQYARDRSCPYCSEWRVSGTSFACT